MPPVDDFMREFFAVEDGIAILQCGHILPNPLINMDRAYCASCAKGEPHDVARLINSRQYRRHLADFANAPRSVLLAICRVRGQRVDTDLQVMAAQMTQEALRAGTGATVLTVQNSRHYDNGERVFYIACTLDLVPQRGRHLHVSISDMAKHKVKPEVLQAIKRAFFHDRTDVVMFGGATLKEVEHMMAPR